MAVLKSTIVRKTKGVYRGKRLVIVVPPECDYIGVRQQHARKTHYIDLATIYDLAIKKGSTR